MRAIRKITFTTVITIILVLVTAFCISGTVISQSKGKSAVEEAYYRDWEREYVQKIRGLLANQGYDNCGVTMTRVIETDGNRDYTIEIHHRRISGLKWNQKQALLEACKDISFPVGNCNFCHKFLEEEM